MLKFTKAQAIDEITYRSIPKPRPARDFVAGDASKASGAELRTKAGQAKPTRKAPAVKAPKAPVGPKELTLEQQVSRLVTRAANAQAAAVEGPGFVKRAINARKVMLSAGDLLAQANAATEVFAAHGDAEAIAALASV